MSQHQNLPLLRDVSKKHIYIKSWVPSLNLCSADVVVFGVTGDEEKRYDGESLYKKKYYDGGDDKSDDDDEEDNDDDEKENHDGDK